MNVHMCSLLCFEQHTSLFWRQWAREGPPLLLYDVLRVENEKVERIKPDEFSNRTKLKESP